MMFASFLAGLVGLAWIVSSVGGYRFGSTVLAMVSLYIALLLAYAFYRRLAHRIRSEKTRWTQQAKELGDAKRR